MCLKSESSSFQHGLEVMSAINWNDSSFDSVFLSQFAKKDLGEGCRYR